MPSVRCPRCERPVAVPDHPGGGWVRCPACRIPFEVGAGGEGFGPRWVLLPLWPWYAVAVFPLLMSLTRLNGSELLWWVVLPPVLLNLALSASNARACGRVWAAARARGGRVGLPGWCGAAHSALGFTWCWLFTLAPLADGRMRLWLDVGLVWGCLLIAPSVLVSGLVITAGSWSDAHRAGGALRHAVAAYDTLATVYNSCAVVADICVFVWAFAGGLPWAPRVFATIMEGFAGFINFGQPGGTEKPLVPALRSRIPGRSAGSASSCRRAPPRRGTSHRKKDT